MKMQLLSVGVEEKLYIPPPWVAEFSLKVQLRSVGLPELMYMPPPKLLGEDQDPLALPPLMAKPSRMAVASVPLPTTTW
jgi:hypothetical protein